MPAAIAVEGLFRWKLKSRSRWTPPPRPASRHPSALRQRGHVACASSWLAALGARACLRVHRWPGQRCWELAGGWRPGTRTVYRADTDRWVVRSCTPVGARRCSLELGAAHHEDRLPVSCFSSDWLARVLVESGAPPARVSVWKRLPHMTDVWFSVSPPHRLPWALVFCFFTNGLVWNWADQTCCHSQT